mgnify:CR=1 FL=1
MTRCYEFKVFLQEITPQIRRSFLLCTTATFDDLHFAIQDSFGWEECHAFEFRLPKYRGRPGEPMPHAGRSKLSRYFTDESVKRCEYVYDFGDDWVHDVKLVGVRSKPEPFHRRLLSGKRACPLVDCGGVFGYKRCVKFVKTGKSPWDDDGLEFAEWLGDWRPDDFDLAECARKFDC